ncbi:MAG: metallophosphoesterase [Planctomycetota bacterium]
MTTLQASLALLVTLGSLQDAASNLPVKPPQGILSRYSVRNDITLQRLHEAIANEGDSEGLTFDFKGPNLQGQVSVGPYPFEETEADYTYARYRLRRSFREGQGSIPIAPLYSEELDANDWHSRNVERGTIAVRFDIWEVEGTSVRHHGFYETPVSFRRSAVRFVRVATIVKGPCVNLVRSDDDIEEGTSVVISWETIPPCAGRVVVHGVGEFASTPQDRHEVRIAPLSHDTLYAYHVEADGVRTPAHSFVTAPERGELPRGKPLRIAVMGDSREEAGGGERTFMGTNRFVLEQLGMSIYRSGGDLILFGGDLISGYTSDTEDYRTQMHAWSYSLAGFLARRPIYPAVGNHETLLNAFRLADNRFASLDKWPYATDSTEALFAREFVLPENGPMPSDRRRPPYRETVYSLQYGPVRIIVLNNNYWYTQEDVLTQCGGCPEGYILEDQLEWLEAELENASEDDTVTAVLVLAQEPVFPNGGHLDDAMWWNGNNGMRACSRMGDLIVPEKLGMIEVRNRLWETIARGPKVAAMLSADEHAYHRTLIDATTPVGVLGDDHDGNGILDAFSPNQAFLHPTWHIVSGGAGAPYYGRERAPWAERMRIYSSQCHYVLLEVDREKVAMKVYSITGQLLDEEENLLAVKKTPAKKGG